MAVFWFLHSLMATTNAWFTSTAPVAQIGVVRPGSKEQQHLRLNHRQLGVMRFAGFGADSRAENKKEAKLKPKQQWDRYLDLKESVAVPAGVRVAQDWLEVGHVKSKESVTTALAVARQRALIVEVRIKRVIPLFVFVLGLSR
jgi:hypothetical protein